MFAENNNSSIIKDRKPMLDTSEMIDDLKRKGVKFEYMSEDKAYEFLEQSTNYFKLRAYRKNFDIATSGPRKGQYLGLDFAALRDLSTLDMRLRYVLIHMCLDIEHCIKIDMIRRVQNNNKNDAYDSVADYIKEYQMWKYGDPNGDGFQRSFFAIQSGDVYSKSIRRIVQFGSLQRFCTLESYCVYMLSFSVDMYVRVVTFLIKSFSPTLADVF